MQIHNILLDISESPATESRGTFMVLRHKYIPHIMTRTLIIREPGRISTEDILDR